MLSCYDRLVITGTLPAVCYAAGMTGYLNAKGIRIFDYPCCATWSDHPTAQIQAAVAAVPATELQRICRVRPRPYGHRAPGVRLLGARGSDGHLDAVARTSRRALCVIAAGVHPSTANNSDDMHGDSINSGSLPDGAEPGAGLLA